MTPVEPISLLETPILPGTNLIEASAGTGKTQTIAGLFVRILLEAGSASNPDPIQVDQILVLTYTEAATEELRERIRGLLVRAQLAFAEAAAGPAPAPDRHSAADPFVDGLVARHRDRLGPLAERLRLAVNCFDLAPIFTIHGFCQRALKDRAFESGSLFDAEVMADQSALLQEVADDFWRRTFYRADPVLLAVALHEGLSPQEFLPLLKSALSHPGLRFVARPKDPPAVIGASLQETLGELRRLWAGDGAAIRGCFGSARKWGNAPYNSDDKIAPHLDAAAALMERDPGALVTPAQLKQMQPLRVSEIKAGVTRRNPARAEPPPAHPFFDRLEEFFQQAADYAVALQLAFVQEAQAALRARKEQEKVLSYDDLLTRLREALNGPGGPELAAELRRRYRAALIDEFQDTDPVQAEIFERIFQTRAGDGGPAPSAPDGHRLFFIGDPKQAIYGFRGADIFSYLRSAENARHRFTLGENWRSDSSLVRAVNTLFGDTKDPFVFPQIGYRPVTAQGRPDATPLRLDGVKPSALAIWFYPRDSKKEISKARAQEDLPPAVAAEISRLLSGPNRIGDRPIRAQDCAVLVMTHHQAQLVQDALHALGIPSVQQTQESVFTSREALELHRVLSAIVRPSAEPGVRAGLATRLQGGTGEELHRLQNDEPAWQRHLEAHRSYLEEWTRHGFAAMFRRWESETGLRARLVALPDGERALTNTLHLAELLHHAAAEENLGPVALVQWLAARLGSRDAATDEYQLRLERDENAVHIVTVHKSKGLQYEVVFVPFCWQGTASTSGRGQNSEREILYHDPATGELRRDLGPEIAHAHRRQAGRERLAESVRLLYVALTRARHRCYLAWGAFKDAGSSGLAWVLHRDRGLEDPGDSADDVPHWKLDFGENNDEKLRADLARRVESSRHPLNPGGASAIEVMDLPRETGAPYRADRADAGGLHQREFTRIIAEDWRIASFSWMTAGQHVERAPDPDQNEAPDRDADDLAPAATPEPEAPAGIFAFPRGSRAGTCLHKILESFELTERDDRKLEQITRRHLAFHGIDPTHGPAVTRAIRHTLDAPMDETPMGESCAPSSSVSTWSLGQIPKDSRVTELEFCFALRPITPADLQRAFASMDLPPWASDWPEQIGRLTFSPARGFMKGFIDLVCAHAGRYYLIDWKSNWLGSRVADYGPDALHREMIARAYVLQYHLYAVALHRHLQLRLPGYQFAQHFGGVRYLFLRGISPETPGHGIFADRPSAHSIEKLSGLLLDPTKDDR